MAQDRDNLTFKYGERGSRILREFNEAQAQKRQAAVQTSAQSTSFMRHGKRSFQAATINKQTSSFLSADVSLNALLESQLPIMRARSRFLSRNTAPGRRFLSLLKNNVVGPSGFRLHMQAGEYQGQKWVLDTIANQTITAGFLDWGQAEHCDAAGQSSFIDQCRLVAETLGRDGEYLVKEIIGTKDTPYRYQLQVLAVDRLDTNFNGIWENGNTVRMGVEVNGAGKPVAYHVLVRNPNDRGGAGAVGPLYRERIASGEIIHGFVKIDPEQVRGVPWAHAIMQGQNMLHIFEESAVTSAAVGASNMGFLIPPTPGDPAFPGLGDGAQLGDDLGDGIDAQGDIVREAVPGAMDILPPGWDLKQFNPAYPHAAFDPFVQSRKRDMASGLDVAHHNLSGDMSGVNYSSARIAELSERDNWRTIQNYLIGAFVMRVAKRWLELSLLAGALVMPDGNPLPITKLDKFRSGLQFKGRGWEWVDPLKEGQAAKLAVDEGFGTRTQVVSSKGGDFEDNVIELAREEDLLQAHNVKLGSKTDAASAGSQPTKEKPTGEEDE